MVNNAIFPCPQCRKPVPYILIEDGQCPNCRAARSEPPPPPPARQVVTKKKRLPHPKRKSSPNYVLITVCVGIVASWLVWQFKVSTEVDPPLPRVYWAQHHAQEWVKDYLKAPKTAEFADSDITESADTDELTEWKFTGKVDAQNSFGAYLRTEYECLVSFDKRRLEYRLMYLILEGKLHYIDPELESALKELEQQIREDLEVPTEPPKPSEGFNPRKKVA